MKADVLRSLSEVQLGRWQPWGLSLHRPDPPLWADHLTCCFLRVQQMFKWENSTQRRCKWKVASGSCFRGLILLNPLHSSNTLNRAGWLCIYETTSAAPWGYHPFHVAEAWARGFTPLFMQACVDVLPLISNTLTDVTKIHVLTTCSAHACSH